MGATVPFCPDRTVTPCLSSLPSLGFLRTRTWHFLIMVLSPVPDPQSILRKYSLKDCKMPIWQAWSKQTSYTILWNEELPHMDSLIRAESGPNVLLNPQNMGRTHKTGMGPIHPCPFLDHVPRTRLWKTQHSSKDTLKFWELEAAAILMNTTNKLLLAFVSLGFSAYAFI